MEERKTITELRTIKFELEKSEEAQRKEKEIRSSKKKAAKKAGFAMFQESVRQASNSPRAPEDVTPVGAEPSAPLLPPREPDEMKVDPTTQPDKNAKYAKQAMLLKEMGFSDQELNLRLLAENGGDVKSVVVVLATAGSCTDLFRVPTRAL